jgi:hypothetical protein
MVKPLTKAETSKTLQKWIKTDGPDAQAYYHLTLQEAMDVSLDRETLIIIRCPESKQEDAPNSHKSGVERSL